MGDTLTQAQLKSALHYDPETGHFTWIQKISVKVVVGKRAGQLKPHGYRAIGLMGTRNLEHRLAFLYMTGEWPADSVDHANGVRDDNRWVNLRQCTHQENLQNQKPRSDRTPGVGWHSLRKRWRATITSGGVQHHLGLFDSHEDAVAARSAAKERLHTFNPIQRMQ